MTWNNLRQKLKKPAIRELLIMSAIAIILVISGLLVNWTEPIVKLLYRFRRSAVEHIIIYFTILCFFLLVYIYRRYYEKKQLIKAIKQVKTDLRRKNKELEQFAYVASHDLQEPLKTTINFVKLFKEKHSGKLNLKEDKYLEYIEQASERMRVLIKDLLDFSRIGHKKELEQVDCKTLLQDIIIDVDKAIQDSGAEIKADSLPVITGNATELKQLFQNLILNSIKFRKQNMPPKINITSKKSQGFWKFALSDNGIGIERKHYERIFIIFQRLHTRTEYAGSGIGLSHCKKIVELHHGKIWVESILGNGSTFYFTIKQNSLSSEETKR